ncbi:MAG: VOC family protein [Kofleriaceae bacterium]|nr:VOC family protein [Kofleriaceae bacterium]
MTHVETHPPGEPTWIDLMTTDPAAARDFYAALFDWTYEIGTPETGHYTMCFRGGRAVAGIGGKPPGSPMPTAWNLYLGTADVDATCASITEGGGTIIAPPMDVLDAGRLAFATDPTGGPFGLWQSKRHTGTQVVDEPGTLCWCELNTRDLDRAAGFFDGLFGLEARDVPMPGGKYVTLHRDGAEQPVGGIMKMTEQWGETPPHWMVYLGTDDTDATAAKITTLGGKVCVPAFDTPYGRIAVVEDPQGAVFSLIQGTGQS